MPKGNRPTANAVLDRIEKARSLLDEALALASKEPKAAAAIRASATTTKVNSGTIDYLMPIRAFVKKYSGNMSGAKKFVLVLAYLAKGDVSKRVALAEIERHWNRMTAKGLLGMKFNRLYTSQARERDWANTEKAGSYHLRPAWKEIFP